MRLSKAGILFCYYNLNHLDIIFFNSQPILLNNVNRGPRILGGKG